MTPGKEGTVIGEGYPASRSMFIARACAVISMVVGCVALVGWALDVTALKMLVPGTVTMKANTALSFVLAGASLLLVLAGTRGSWRHRAGRTLALGPALIGLLTLSEYVFELTLHIDQLLFRESPGAIATLVPGRMAPTTALCFVLVGLTLLILDRRRGPQPAQVLAVITSVVALLGLLPYVYGLGPHTGAFARNTPMALNTAGVFLLLVAGLLLARSDRGLMAVVTSDSAGGTLARRLLPVTVGLPILIGGLAVVGQRIGLYDAGFRVSASTAANAAALAAAVWFGARSLHLTDLARREAEDIRAQIFRTSPSAMFLTRLEDGRFVDANERFVRTFGWPKDEIVGRTSLELGIWPDAAGRAAVMQTLRERDHVSGAEALLRTRSGEVRSFLYSAQVIELGGKPHVLGSLEDVTEHRGLEEALRDSHERMATILETVPAACFTVDAEFRLTFLNSLAAMLMRKPAVELIGKNLWQEFPEAVGTPLYDSSVRAMAERVTVEVEAFYPPFGVWFEAAVHPMEDGLLAFFRDVTERRRTAVRFRSLIEAAPIGISISTPEGRVIEGNPTVQKIFGYDSEEEFLKSPALAHWSDPKDRERFVALLEKGAARDFEARFRRTDGSVFWGSVTSVAVADDVETNQIINTFQDITERKRAEDEVRRLNAELEQRVRERTAELEAANGELEAFSYTVSHDLRAPLRAMDGFSRILVEEHAAELPPEAQRRLGVVRENAVRMGWLIDDLLNFSRLGRQALRKQVVDPANVVHQALAELEDEREERRIEMTIGDLPPCRADPSLLKVVFENLLSNALKFTRKRDPARIELGARVEDGMPCYFVRDNGAGFDMRYADKLFGVFQRLHPMEEYEGTGVGLATVQRIVHRHGGRVWAEAEVEKGATFHFTLEGGSDG